MEAKILACRLVRAFENIPFQKGAIIEIVDYERGQQEARDAEQLNEIMRAAKSFEGILHYNVEDKIVGIYGQFQEEVYSLRRLTWLLYGGMFNCCIKNTMLNIMEGGPGLANDSISWLGLPLFALNKYGTEVLNGRRYQYKNEDSIVERLAEHSIPGEVTTGEDNVYAMRRFTYFLLPYPRDSRVSIRKDGEVLRVIDPQLGPTFVLDFYTSWEDMFRNAFQGKAF